MDVDPRILLCPCVMQQEKPQNTKENLRACVSGVPVSQTSKNGGVCGNGVVAAKMDVCSPEVSSTHFSVCVTGPRDSKRAYKQLLWNGSKFLNASLHGFNARSPHCGAPTFAPK